MEMCFFEANTGFVEGPEAVLYLTVWFYVFFSSVCRAVDFSVRARRGTCVTDHQCVLSLSEWSPDREDGSKITCCGRGALRTS